MAFVSSAMAGTLQQATLSKWAKPSDHCRAVHWRARTQLTMRTFPQAVAGDDITRGLPRVEELFEARSRRALP